MSAIRYCGRCLSTFESDPVACPNLGCAANRPGSGWGTVLGKGDVLDRTYEVERCLAVGGAGLTYLGRELDPAGKPVGPRVAIKVLYTARAAGPFLRRLSTEAQILQELAHENIVELRGFVHRAGQEPYLVTRFEEGGSLVDHIERVGAVSPRVAVGILRQVLLGLDVAHQRGVVHRDLKPDNVLLSAVTPRDTIPRILVADFGIAKIAGGMVGERLTRMGSFVGTPEYAAPEQFEGQVPTPATDVFAAGGLFVYLLTGQPPFQFTHRADIATTYEEMQAQLPLKLPALNYIEGDDATRALIREVLDQMLVIAQDRRATIHRVLALLSPLLDPSIRSSATIDMSTSAVPTPPFLRRPVLPTGDAPPAPPPTAGGADAYVTDPIAVASHPALSRSGRSVPPDEEAADTELTEPPPVGQDAITEVSANHGDRLAAVLLDDAPPPPPPSSTGIPLPNTATNQVPPPPPRPTTLPQQRGTATDTEVSASVLAPPIPPDPGESGIGHPPEFTDATEEQQRTRPPTLPQGDERTAESALAWSDATETEAGTESRRGEPGQTGVETAVDPQRPRTDGKGFAPVAPPPPFFQTGPMEPPVPVVMGASTAASASTPAPPQASGGRSGGTAGLAGCFGLSLFGVIGASVVGFLGVAVVLVGIAAATGWIPGPGGGNGPIVVGDEVPERFKRAPALSDNDQRKVLRSARELKSTIAEHCGSGAAVNADLLVDKGGDVVYAKVNPGGLGSVDPACVKRGLEKVSVRGGVAAEGIGHVDLAL